jgi:hypothetical protein
MRALVSLCGLTIYGTLLLHETIIHKIWNSWFPDGTYIERVVLLDDSTFGLLSIRQMKRSLVCCPSLSSSDVLLGFGLTKSQAGAKYASTSDTTNGTLMSNEPEQADLSTQDVFALINTLTTGREQLDALQENEISASVESGANQRFRLERTRGPHNELPFINRLVIGEHDIDLSDAQITGLIKVLKGSVENTK